MVARSARWRCSQCIGDLIYCRVFVMAHVSSEETVLLALHFHGAVRQDHVLPSVGSTSARRARWAPCCHRAFWRPIPGSALGRSIGSWRARSVKYSRPNLPSLSINPGVVELVASSIYSRPNLPSLSINSCVVQRLGVRPYPDNTEEKGFRASPIVLKKSLGKLMTFSSD
jgi:hypothetical protein